MPTLTSTQQRALDTCSNALMTYTVLAPIRPQGLRTEEDVRAWLPQAQAGLAAAKKAAQDAVRIAQAQVDASKKGADDDDAWKRLETACEALEQAIVRMPTHATRISEGQKSMKPRVVAVVAEQLQPVVREAGGRLVAELDPGGLRALEQELPRWVQAWSEYAYSWVEVDFDRELQQLWRQRAGDLPVPPPGFERLRPATVEGGIQFPSVVVEREQTGMASSMLRNGRAILYGLMSFAFLANVNSDPDMKTAVLVVGVPVAVIFGFVQARSERLKEQEKLVAEARKSAATATSAVLDAWLDRCGLKLTEQARQQLMARREALITWYRTQVAPLVARRSAEQARRSAQAELAKKELQKQEPLLRDIEKAIAAVEALARGLGAEG